MRDTESDSKTYLSPSGCHSGGGSDIVEAANDAESAGRPCNPNSDLNANACMKLVRDRNRVKRCANILISHHTGAQLMAFPLHKIESTKWTRQASDVQIMYMQVPTFQASKCQYRGTTERTNPIPENTVNAVLDAAMSSLCFLKPPEKRYEVFKLV
jgi:hypothetical protein